MSKRTKFWKYFREYTWSNVFAMIRNNRLQPAICTDDFNGRLVVISGATSGIGYYTAREYASHGADLLCINRNIEKSESLCREIVKDFGVKCTYRIADLSKLQDIKIVAEELLELDTPIDILIHNAGAYLTKKELTADGLEKVFVVQYLSSFIINNFLLEKLMSRGRGRIIFVNSEGHRFATWGLRLDDLNWERRRYSGLKSYGSAKLAQLLSMVVLNDKLPGSGITVNAMHPGAVKTETGQENGPAYRWFKKNLLDRTLKPPQMSARALYYLGVSKDIDDVSGKFFNLTTEEAPAPPALDREVAYQLWEKSMEICRLHGLSLD